MQSQPQVSAVTQPDIVVVGNGMVGPSFWLSSNSVQIISSAKRRHCSIQSCLQSLDGLRDRVNLSEYFSGKSAQERGADKHRVLSNQHQVDFKLDSAVVKY